MKRCQSSPGPNRSTRGDVKFPLIPKEETGALAQITGADLDEYSLVIISLPDVTRSSGLHPISRKTHGNS
jgi:hypothetical protein